MVAFMRELGTKPGGVGHQCFPLLLLAAAALVTKNPKIKIQHFLTAK